MRRFDGLRAFLRAIAPNLIAFLAVLCLLAIASH